MIRTLEKPVAGLSKVLMLVASLLMVLAPGAPWALAQEKATGFDPYPLRPPDTSSPRDTLRSFLTNTNAFIEDWRRNPGAIGTESYRAYTRAIETLDLSTTTDQNSRMVRTLRVLFLKEILDRIEVPPDTEIPPARVRFIGYGPYSKDVEIFSYLNCQEQNDFLAIQ